MGLRGTLTIGVLATLGCARGNTELLVDVQDIPDGTATLSARLTLDGVDASRPATWSAPAAGFGATTSFVLLLPHGGHLRLQLSALAADDHELAGDTVDARVADRRSSELAVRLMATPAVTPDLATVDVAPEPPDAAELVPPWLTQGSTTAAPLRALWSSAATDVYAAGSQLLLHSGGDGAWTNKTFTFGLDGVWGSGSADVYVVGYGGSIFHYNGAWSTQSSATFINDLHGIWGSGSGDVYVAGAGGLILHSAGDGKWLAQPSGVSTALNGVWGSSATDVYVVGADGVILHSSGANWTAQPIGISADLFAVWGSAANDLYAAGAGGTLLHSDGSGAWTPQSSGTSFDLFGVSGDAGEALVVGDAGTILRSRGHGPWSWQPSGVTLSLFGVTKTSGGDAYAVGAGGTILHRAGF